MAKEDELIMISLLGDVIRLAVKQISELGKRTSGVKLKNIDQKKDRIVAVAKVQDMEE